VVKEASQSFGLEGESWRGGRGQVAPDVRVQATVPHEYKVLEAYSVAQGKVSAWFRSVLKVAPESGFSPNSKTDYLASFTARVASAG
jgi:hypothetical protein